MTKKHFNQLAQALRDAKPNKICFPYNRFEREGELKQWMRDCGVIAAVCASHNPQFDPKRFADACGI